MVETTASQRGLLKIAVQGGAVGAGAGGRGAWLPSERRYDGITVAGVKIGFTEKTPVIDEREKKINRINRMDYRYFNMLDLRDFIIAWKIAVKRSLQKLTEV